MTKSFHSCSKCNPVYVSAFCDKAHGTLNDALRCPTCKTKPITIDRASAEQVQYEIEAGSCGAIKEE